MDTNADRFGMNFIESNADDATASEFSPFERNGPPVTAEVRARFGDPESPEQDVWLTRDELQCIIEEQRVLGARYAVDSILIRLRDDALGMVEMCGRMPHAGAPCVADAFESTALFRAANDLAADFYGTEGTTTGLLRSDMEHYVRTLMAVDEARAYTPQESLVPIAEMLYEKSTGGSNERRENEQRAMRLAQRTIVEFRVAEIRNRLRERLAKPEPTTGIVSSLLARLDDLHAEQEAFFLAQRVAETYPEFLTLWLGQDGLDAITERVGLPNFDLFVARVESDNAKSKALDESGASDEEIVGFNQALAQEIEADPVLGPIYAQVDTLSKAWFRTGKLPDPNAAETNAKDADTLKDVLASLDAAIPLDPM